MKTILYLIISFLLLPISTSAGFFGPSNYDECVLENMKGVTSDQAARAIQYACRKKFPIETEDMSKYDDINDEQLKKIDGKAGLHLGIYFSGNLYNGNSDVTIKQVTISVETKIGGELKNNEYTVDIDIKPFATAAFDVKILPGDEGAEYSWTIESAKGF